MTKENAKEYLPLVQALVEGKTVQFYNESLEKWVDVDEKGLSFALGPKDYRIKPPEPQLRPFKPEEVPVGAVVRHKQCHAQVSMLVSVSTVYETVTLFVGQSPAIDLRMFTLLDNYEWRWPNTSNDWQPCGIME